MEVSAHVRTLRLRIVAEAGPPQERSGRATEFGLQDKDQALQPGRAQPDGSLQFELEVQAKLNPATGAPRFSGPFVHGTTAVPFLYLSWKYEGVPPEWIARQKLPLGALSWERIEEASKHPPASFRATVPPITAPRATGTVPVDWILEREGA